MRKALLVTAIFTLMCGFSAMAQTSLKLGHINKQDLITTLPEYDSAMAQLDKVAKELQSHMEQMQVEFNRKYEDYLKNSKTMSDLIRQTTETDLQDMNQRIQNFQATAEQDIQEQRAKLLKPILDKVNTAISDVGKENKFTYLFDASPGSTVIFQSTDSQDVTALVKKKLGIQ